MESIRPKSVGEYEGITNKAPTGRTPQLKGLLITETKPFNTQTLLSRSTECKGLADCFTETVDGDTLDLREKYLEHQQRNSIVDESFYMQEQFPHPNKISNPSMQYCQYH